MRDGGGGRWLVRMEWRPAGWSVCLPLLIFPCTVKSSSSLLATAHLGGPGKTGRKTVVAVVYLGHEEALGEEHDLADLLHVGNDDDDRTEERLDGLRQLRASGVARIHRDEDSDTVIHRDLLPFELTFPQYDPFLRFFLHFA